MRSSLHPPRQLCCMFFLIALLLASKRWSHSGVDKTMLNSITFSIKKGKSQCVDKTCYLGNVYMV